jgi:KAP family P-loop domain
MGEPRCVRAQYARPHYLESAVKLKPIPFEIPADDPFRNDVLGRKATIERLSNLALNVTPPFVFCIDSPWGGGKTTFLRLWEAHLASSEAEVLYFDAWKTDFAADPLVAFVGEIAELAEKRVTTSTAAASIKAVKTLGAKIAKRALPVAAKLVTAGFITADDFTEGAAAGLAEQLAEDAVQAYESGKKLISQFHEALTNLIDHLSKDGKKNRLLILVDELDRCRPTYALDLLERIKHVFDVPNVVFALALDKRQLRASIASVYGPGIAGEEYLRRFIDLDFSLPKPKAKAFTKYLFGQFDFDQAFAGRTSGEFRYDREHLESTFNELADLFDLSLRAREQCFARLRFAMLSTPDDNYIYPDVLMALIILRSAAKDVYDRFVSKNGTVADVLECLKARPEGSAYLEGRSGALLEAFLIGARRSVSDNGVVPEQARYEQLANDTAANAPTRQRAEMIVSLLQEMAMRRGQMPLLRHILPRIELYDERE